MTAHCFIVKTGPGIQEKFPVQIHTSEDDFEERSQKYLQNPGKIHQFCTDKYQTLFFRFLDEMKVDVEDKDEAAKYLEDDFIQEFGISQIIIRSLSNINGSEYPGEKKIFCSAIQERAES